MSLVLYSVMLFFPGGGSAAGASVLVHLHGSNQSPLLFTDSAGAVPAANPLTADGMGIIQFYAAPGHYMAELGGEVVYVPIDPTHTAPVWQDVWVHDQPTLATVWTVEHHFGLEPDVEVLVAGSVAEVEVFHPDNETTVITFGAPTVGVAYLRR